MSTALLPAPQLVESSADPDRHHLFCCDPKVAVCGFVVSDGEDFDPCPDDCDCLMCELCQRVADMRCLSSECTDGQTWQVSR